MNKADYRKGYNAGKMKAKSETNKLQTEIAQLKGNVAPQRERVYMKCLELVLKHCRDWDMAGEKIVSAGGYCKLAKVFADNSISWL